MHQRSATDFTHDPTKCCERETQVRRIDHLSDKVSQQSALCHARVATVKADYEMIAHANFESSTCLDHLLRYLDISARGFERS